MVFSILDLVFQKMEVVQSVRFWIFVFGKIISDTVFHLLLPLGTLSNLHHSNTKRVTAQRHTGTGLSLHANGVFLSMQMVLGTNWCGTLQFLGKLQLAVFSFICFPNKVKNVSKQLSGGRQVLKK